MKVLLYGATGMIGSGVLQECLDDPRVGSVLALVRTPTGRTHKKLREVAHDDFVDYAALHDVLTGVDACYFCLGVSALGMGEEAYHRITYELTMTAAKALLHASPQAVFCYVSGAGTDATERGRTMWARVKGKTENRLLVLPFRRVLMFRPGFIQPLKGVRSKTRLYDVSYRILGPFYPVLQRLFPGGVTTSVKLGRAMIEATLRGHPTGVIEGREINRLAEAAPAAPG